MKIRRGSANIHHDPARAVLRTLDFAIAAIAGPQHGVITREQLLELGMTDGGISYRVAIGRLHRLHDGVYAVGHRPVSPLPHAMAAVLACGPGAALSHGSAATLWGIAQHWHTPLEVTARSARRRARLRIHRSTTLTPEDITEHYGIPVTTPARTLLDNAGANGLTDTALARAVNDLRLAHYLNLADISELLARHPQTKATKRLRPHVAHPHRAPTRSEFEDAFIIFAKRYALPDPLVNADVAGHEADIYYPAQKLVIELDGYETHGTRDQFESDRDRDMDLLAAGIATARVTWDRMRQRPKREAARLHAILATRAPAPHSP